MRILSRYFLASYLRFFVAILLSATVAVMVIEMMLNFDDILEHREGFGGVVTYLLLRIPSYYLPDLLPVASFAAAFFCLGLPARAHEITAIKTGGISPRQAVVPVLCAAAALSGVALVIEESLVLEASREWSRLSNPEGEITFRQGSFWYHRGNAIYNVQEVDHESRVLYGVSVFELNPQGRLIKSIRAKRVEVGDNSRWRFFDATARVFDPSQPAKPPETEYLKSWERDVTAEKDLALIEASAKTLSLINLRSYIQSRDRDGHDTIRYRALFHSRLAEPLTVFLFALLAAPLGLAVEHSRSLAASALYGIVVVGAFYTTRTTAEMFAAGGFASAALSPWLILTFFGGYGTWRLFRVER